VRYNQTARAKYTHFVGEREDPVAGARVPQRFDAAERMLERFPYLGREGRQAGTRELVLSGTPYVFVYRAEERA
jgi:plasmid stabilization system protein ParE